MLYTNGCCGYWLDGSGQQGKSNANNANNSNGQRSRTGGARSNSNNSVAINVSGCQLKKSCLINQPAIVTKVHWQNSNSHCLHNSHLSSNHHQPQNSWWRVITWHCSTLTKFKFIRLFTWSPLLYSLSLWQCCSHLTARYRWVLSSFWPKY